MARPRKADQQPDAQESSRPVAKGQDAIITVELQTANGTVARHYRLPGFVGNTLAWQRSGKGLDDIITPALQRAFGGQVTAE